MKMKPISAALLAAFGLGKTNRAVSAQLKSVEQVKAASTLAQKGTIKQVGEAIVIATDQAAEF